MDLTTGQLNTIRRAVDELEKLLDTLADTAVRSTAYAQLDRIDEIVGKE